MSHHEVHEDTKNLDKHPELRALRVFVVKMIEARMKGKSDG
jgi:hypothetical protein